MRQRVEHYEYQVLDEASEILRSVGMPQNQCNPRCAMTLVACAEIKPDGKWKYASENYHGPHDIIRFINEHYPNKASLDDKGYQENSRETFRDETLKPWVSAGIMEARFGLASNSKDNAYRFTAQFVALIRKFGTPTWEDTLAAFMANHQSYAQMLKQVKELAPGYPVNYGGLEFTLGRTPHNKLQKSILDVFVPNFASGAELLYIGDTSDRAMCMRNDRLKELGIYLFSESAKLPDIVLYDAFHHRVLFVEAYYSGGEFTLDRVNEIKSYCHCDSDMEIAFVTAFDTMKKALRVFKTIAWDTDIWVAEYDTHMIHKNGDRFIGRTL